MLLRVEKELAALAQDQTWAIFYDSIISSAWFEIFHVCFVVYLNCSRNVMKFPTMSSYNRMLIHRVAAWFGMEHNVDGTLQCVIVATAKSTRLPEVCEFDTYAAAYVYEPLWSELIFLPQIRFKSLLSDTFTDEPSKKILKRDVHSFEEYRQVLLNHPDRGGMADRKAKSFEQREQEYERAKRRIFKDAHNESGEGFWPTWTSPFDQSKNKGQHNRLKVQSSSVGIPL